jgi:hypothetical protein
LNIGDSFDQDESGDSPQPPQRSVETFPSDTTSLTQMRSDGSSCFQEPSSVESSTEKDSNFQESGDDGHFHENVSNLQQVNTVGSHLNEPPGFPPQREVGHLHAPGGFFQQSRGDPKPISIQPLVNLGPNVQREDESVSPGLTVSPMLLTQLWQTLRNNRNATS